jgi:hypothetical protein
VEPPEAAAARETVAATQNSSRNQLISHQLFFIIFIFYIAIAGSLFKLCLFLMAEDL